MARSLEGQSILDLSRSVRDAEMQYNTLGGATSSEQLDAEMALQDQPLFSLSQPSILGRAVADTPVPNVINWATLNFGMEDDPDFDISKYNDEILKYPDSTLTRFRDVRSEEQLRYLMNDIDQEMEDDAYIAAAGGSGVVASLLSATVDPLSYLPLKWSYTGYKAANMASKVPFMSPRGAGVAYGVGAGAEATALSVGINELTSPTGNVAEAIPTLAYGMAFGGFAGATGVFDPLMRSSVKKFVDGYDPATVKGADMSEDLDQTIHMPEGMATKFGRTSVDTGPKTGADTKGSIGAAVAPGNVQDLDGKGLADNELDIISDFRTFNKTHQITDDDMELKGHPVGNWIYNQLQKGILGHSPFRTAFDTGFNSGSDVLRGLTFMTLNSAAGIANNVQSVGYMADRMIGQIAGAPIQAYKREFKAWLVETGLPNNNDSYRAFNREAQMYAQDKYWGSAPRSQSKAIERLFEHEEYGAKVALDWLQDAKNGGKTAVNGSTDLDSRPGWRPLRWSWQEMKRVGKAHGLDDQQLRATLEKALIKGYRKVHKNLSKDDLAIWAKAVLRRSHAMEQGVDTNLIRMLDQEGEGYALRVLTDSGVDEARALRLIETLRGISNTDTPKILQHRNEIDLRTPIDGMPGMTLMDLTEFDQGKTWMNYSRHASFAGARARWGLQSGDVSRLLNIADRELEAKGLPALDQKFKDYFDRALSGNALNDVNPWARRLNMASTLSLMNTQGLTQLTDTGIAMGTLGFKTYVQAARKVVKDALEGNADKALDEMARVNVAINGEHHYIQPERYLDDVKRTSWYQNELTEFIDGLMVKGVKLQNMISGFETVHKMQHRIVARAYIQNFGDYANGKKTLSDARLEDMGFFGSEGKKRYDRIIQNFKKDGGKVEYDDEGNIIDLHSADWDDADWEFFMATQHHVGNQLTMKLMRGEQSVWQSETFGYMLSHLRSFTLGALQKQTVRHMRIMDAETAATALYSFLTAGTVLVAREAISGKEDKNLDADHIVRGALGLSAFTGGPAMGMDLLGAFMGIDAMRVSNYRTLGPSGTQIVPNMIALDQADRMLHVPFSIFNVVTGNYDKQDVNALQSLPIIGNLYGFTWMFNRMKASVDERREEEKREAREAAKLEKAIAAGTVEAPPTPDEIRGRNTIIGNMSDENLTALQEAGFLK